MLTLWLVTGCEYLPQPAPAVPTLVFVPPPTATLPPTVLHVVKRDNIQEIAQARGRVASVQEAFLSFKIEGWLMEINVNPGDLVVTMGAGDIWKVADEYIQWLRRNY